MGGGIFDVQGNPPDRPEIFIALLPAVRGVSFSPQKTPLAREGSFFGKESINNGLVLIQ